MNVTYIDHMGSDLTVVNAARVSFGKHKDILEESDEKLIKYLAKHNHWTPFGHPQLTLRIKAPMFVARQLFKHKVGLTENEVSRRYVSDAPEYYWPEKFRRAAPNKKQGSSQEPFSSDLLYSAKFALDDLVYLYYKRLISEGLCPEQARMFLPQATYTEWYWTGSLAAFARVVHLRSSQEAQEETRMIAKMIEDELKRLFPVSSQALFGEVSDET